MTFLLLKSAVFASRAFAQDPCAGISGCSASSNTLVPYIAVVAGILLEVASGLAMVGVVIGGAFFILNLGNESQATKGKTAIVSSLIALAIALSSQAIVSFVVARAGYVNYTVPHLGIMSVVVGSIVYIMNVAFALSMLFFGFKLVIGRGQSSELDAAKKGLTWTIIGAAAINLSYAAVDAIRILWL